MVEFVRQLINFLRREDGPTAVEYAVMLALVIVVCVSVIGGLGVGVQEVCDTVCETLRRRRGT